jgi:hypothetical protein
VGADLSLRDWMAAYAALVSSIALAWNIYRAYSDRGKLRVRCQCRKRDEIAHGQYRFSVRFDPRTNVVLHWTLTNVGTKPLMVTRVAAVLLERGKESASENINKMLAPEEEETLETRLAKLEASKIHALSAWDTLGREYRAPREDREAVRNLKMSDPAV